MTRRLALPAGALLLAAALLGFVIACSGDDSPPPTSSDVATASVADGTPATALPTSEISVDSTVKTQYYEVQGKTTQEILSYIKQNGPLDSNGTPASGLTRAEWSLEWSRTSSPRTCAIRTMTIKMDLVMILPGLDASTLPDDLQSNWTQYAANIATHEQRHVDIYIEGANTLKDRMAALTAQPDCSQLEDEVTTVWEDQRAVTNQAQNDFHAEDSARIEAKRQPVRDQIDANNARLTSLLAQINSLDVRIADLNGQLEATAPQIESLSQAIKDIEDKYDGISLPPDVREQYESLRAQYIALLPAYNTLVNQYNTSVSQRNDLAKQHGGLTNETNQLIETYNWLN